ncbi:uncharacterized protein LOC124813293 isoform X5 [Hydra vulgaris]|uniref:uncharacterized protein LOC124813293 isoform X5 n=1 Tax=Hydra vulgaris TaxID=6087 RepID=UPI0032EA7DFE
MSNLHRLQLYLPHQLHLFFLRVLCLVSFKTLFLLTCVCISYQLQYWFLIKTFFVIVTCSAVISELTYEAYRSFRLDNPGPSSNSSYKRVIKNIIGIYR